MSGPVCLTRRNWVTRAVGTIEGSCGAAVPKHMDDIISGRFSSGMMADWANDDKKLLTDWREETGKTAFETAPQFEGKIGEQGTSVKAC